MLSRTRRDMGARLHPAVASYGRCTFPASSHGSATPVYRARLYCAGRMGELTKTTRWFDPRSCSWSSVSCNAMRTSRCIDGDLFHVVVDPSTVVMDFRLGRAGPLQRRNTPSSLALSAPSCAAPYFGEHDGADAMYQMGGQPRRVFPFVSDGSSPARALRCVLWEKQTHAPATYKLGWTLMDQAH